ncbi:minor capsid protein [Actinomadura gamaensis]|uniref:Minor capsid protein n=1 Tax=Actinomadura gamaensis TaxID=1763541 RepID=A0ABV9U7R7_9ACTN
MAWTNDLLAGLAAHLAAAGIGQWKPVGTYDPASAVPAITLRTLPDRPDRAIALDLFADVDADDAGLADVLAAVQIQTRGTRDPSDVDDLADAIWDRLHGAQMLTLDTGPAAVHTTLIRRRSSDRLGADEHGRYLRSCNYYVNAARPNAYRPD